jgi:hypothetical protein
MGIGVGLAMAGHNEANENSTNGDNNVSSKTSRVFYTHLVSIYSMVVFLPTLIPESFDNEKPCLHPSLEGRGNVVVGDVCAGIAVAKGKYAVNT